MGEVLRGTTALLFASWLLVIQVHAESPAMSAEQWRQDLDAFAQQAPRVHKNLFHAMTREQFEADIQRLRGRIPALSHNQIIVELTRLVARIGDGHSYISLLEPPISFRRYPIKLYEFPDGVYVVSADPKYKAIVGGRVVEVGNTPFEQAYRAVTEIVPRDNQMQVKWMAPNYATIPEVLEGLGLASDVENLALTVVKDGKRIKERVAPATARGAHFHGWGTEPGWDAARAPRATLPLWASEPDGCVLVQVLAAGKSSLRAIQPGPEQD